MLIASILSTMAPKDPGPPGKGESCPDYVLPLCPPSAFVASVTEYLLTWQRAQLSPTVGRTGGQCEVLALTAWLGSWQRGVRVEFEGPFPHQDFGDAMGISQE